MYDFRRFGIAGAVQRAYDAAEYIRDYDAFVREVNGRA